MSSSRFTTFCLAILAVPQLACSDEELAGAADDRSTTTAETEASTGAPTGGQDPAPPAGREETITAAVTGPAAGGVAGYVTTSASDPYANRCATNPVNDLGVLQVDPPYVMAYRSGKSGCGVWAPTTSDVLVHRQGIQRLTRNNKNYFVVSNSVDSGNYPGIEIVELKSRGATAEKLGGNVTPSSWPACSDHIVKYLAYSSTTRDHAGGIQVSGSYAIVPLESSGDTTTAGFRIANLSDPGNPVWGNTVFRSRGQTFNAGAAALTRLSDSRFMALIFGNDSDDVEVFLSTSSGMPGFSVGSSWTSVALAPTPSGFEAYQNVQLIADCVGNLFVLGTHQNLFPEDDWADLWRVQFSDTYAPSFTKVKNRNVKCKSGNTGQTRYCDLQAGAGGYVSASGRLLLYGVEHYNDAYPGTGDGVKVREFYP